MSSNKKTICLEKTDSGVLKFIVPQLSFMNQSIAKYIEKQTEPKKTLLLKARELIMKSIADCKEEFKWGVPVYDGGKFYIAAMKTRIHIGFAITGLSTDEVNQFEGTGKTMKHIKIHSLEEFDQLRLTKLIKLVHQKTSPPSDYQTSQ